MLQAGILPAGIMGKTPAAAPATTPASKPEKFAAKTVDELTGTIVYLFLLKPFFPCFPLYL